MQYLTRLSNSPSATYYEIGGAYGGTIHRYVVSTPQSRKICNSPEILGCDYTNALREAVTSALIEAPFRAVFDQSRQSQVSVLSFLRGGLNFGLRDALHDAYGLNSHSSSFMSSQRYRVDGRWEIREDRYRKLRLPPGAVLVTGDVVATGVTVAHGLEVVIDHLRNIGSSISQIVFFTVGCHKIEKVLEAIEPQLREAFPDYIGSHVVYLEGKFHLVDSRTELRIGLPGTDLIRRDALLAPEFEASGLDRPSNLLERCNIYDAGSRAFDIPDYTRDVVDYWKSVAEFARGGLTLGEAITERWPASEYKDRASFFATKNATWRGIDHDFLERLFVRHQRFWSEEVGDNNNSSAALEVLCEERIATLVKQGER